MAEENQVPADSPEGGKSLKEAGVGLFNAVKTPVFWMAVGFASAMWFMRKKV